MTERTIRPVRVTPTVDTAAYADGDRIGSIMSFSGPLTNIREGLVRSVCLIVESGTYTAMTLHLFRSSPTVASADNNALDITDAQMTANWVGAVNIPATSHTNLETLANSAVVHVNNLALAVDTTDGTLYGILQAQGAITFAAADDLTVILGIETV